MCSVLYHETFFFVVVFNIWINHSTLSKQQLLWINTQMSPWYKYVTTHLTTRYNEKAFDLILKGLFVLLEEIKKG